MHPSIEKIASRHNLELLEVSPLSGGDINAVFLLKCTSEKYVLKLNSAAQFPEMFEAEAKGLRLLSHSNSFTIPKVVGHGIVAEASYLLLEYIPPGAPQQGFWNEFSEKLAALHQTSSLRFGLDHSNYIGSLKQQNNWQEDAPKFYISERLEPQLKLADERGFHFSNLNSFYKNISEEIPSEPPALIHGDLWNGNYLASSTSAPVLIDPAVAFAPREMDLAMMSLFGGFPSEVIERYHEIFPLAENWKDRISLWQLYYLLVHLNLFGASYRSRVETILKSFT
jgi:hypothetical protein